jgi:hypothetical protein
MPDEGVGGVEIGGSRAPRRQAFKRSRDTFEDVAEGLAVGRAFRFCADLRGGFDFVLAIGLLPEIRAALSGAALAKQAALGQNGRKWPIFTG